MAGWQLGFLERVLAPKFQPWTAQPDARARDSALDAGIKTPKRIGVCHGFSGRSAVELWEWAALSRGHEEKLLENRQEQNRWCWAMTKWTGHPRRWRWAMWVWRKPLRDGDVLTNRLLLASPHRWWWRGEFLGEGRGSKKWLSNVFTTPSLPSDAWRQQRREPATTQCGRWLGNTLSSTCSMAGSSTFCTSSKLI